MLWRLSYSLWFCYIFFWTTLISNGLHPVWHKWEEIHNTASEDNSDTFENLFLCRSRWNFSSRVGNKCTPRSSIPAFGSFDAYWSELSDVLALSSSKAFSIRRHLCLTSGDRWRRQRWQADKIAKDDAEGFSSTRPPEWTNLRDRRWRFPW